MTQKDNITLQNLQSQADTLREYAKIFNNAEDFKSFIELPVEISGFGLMSAYNEKKSYGEYVLGIEWKKVLKVLELESLKDFWERYIGRIRNERSKK